MEDSMWRKGWRRILCETEDSTPVSGSRTFRRNGDIAELAAPWGVCVNFFLGAVWVEEGALGLDSQDGGGVVPQDTSELEANIVRVPPVRADLLFDAIIHTVGRDAATAALVAGIKKILTYFTLK